MIRIYWSWVFIKYFERSNLQEGAKLGNTFTSSGSLLECNLTSACWKHKFSCVPNGLLTYMIPPTSHHGDSIIWLWKKVAVIDPNASRTAGIQNLDSTLKVLHDETLMLQIAKIAKIQHKQQREQGTWQWHKLEECNASQAEVQQLLRSSSTTPSPLTRKLLQTIAKPLW